MIDFREDVLPLKNKLFRLALRLTGVRADAEDIVQETLIKVWNKRAELDKIASVEAFSLTICRHLALDHLARFDNRHETLDDATADTARDQAATPLMQVAQDDRRTWVMELFRQLPEKQKTIMQLRDIEGKSYKEIAQVLDITEEQVKVTLFRARQHIRQTFEKIENYGL
jgi:RNA polymerase sigma-70 factor (ECF subfamily)